MTEKNDFEFKYSAPTTSERREIESIRNSYMPKTQQTSKLHKLRALDNKVKSITQAISIACGTIGILIFGLGLTLFLEWQQIVWGIVVGIIGLVPVGIAYPIFSYISKKLKNKYGEEIIKLSNELLNDENK
jgi:magnesium-transporting ATPase (P-type)